MNRKKFSQIINPALDSLFKHDEELLQINVSERAITHRLAYYMQRQLKKQSKGWENNLPNYVVDCEYNREGKQVKRLPYTNYLVDKRRVLYAPCPDIILHERLNNDHNELVIEVKKARGGELDELLEVFDLIKLISFAQPHLNYSYGLFLVFEVGKEKCRLAKAKLLPLGNFIELCPERSEDLLWRLRAAWSIMRTKNKLTALQKRRLLSDAKELIRSSNFENVLAKGRRAVVLEP